MANQEHLNLLVNDVEIWNEWRKQHPEVQPDLYFSNLARAELDGADLHGANLCLVNFNKVSLKNANLSGADLRNASLSGADLYGANLSGANLSGNFLFETLFDGTNLSSANLSNVHLLSNIDFGGVNLSNANLSDTDFSGTNFYEAILREANLREAVLSEADLRKADLHGADLNNAYLVTTNLSGADLSSANLNGAILNGAILIQTNLTDATLTNCSVYGASIWDVQLKGAKQTNLVVTPNDEPTITVDNLKVAQFIYLLLNSEEIRDVINTLSTKAVLILGRFTPERKVVLDALREELRKQDYVPMLFDFDEPTSRDITETVTTLAHISRFIIADITDPRSIPQELYASKLIMRQVPVTELEACQVQKDCRYDEAGHQGCGRASQSAF